MGLIGHLSNHTSPSGNTTDVAFRPEPIAEVAKRTVLTDTDEAEIARRYLAGERVTDLADVFDVHRATIANRLDRLGVRTEDPDQDNDKER